MNRREAIASLTALAVVPSAALAIPAPPVLDRARQILALGLFPVCHQCGNGWRLPRITPTSLDELFANKEGVWNHDAIFRLDGRKYRWCGPMHDFPEDAMNRIAHAKEIEIVKEPIVAVNIDWPEFWQRACIARGYA